MKNKVVALIAIAMLLAPAGYSSTDVDPTTYLPTGFNIKHFLTEENLEHATLALYLFVIGLMTMGVTSDISKNFESYIIMNPAPTQPEVLDVMNYFISLIQKAYVLAIAATAFYILLFSISPKQRAKSKSMIGRLVIGLLLVTISPYMMNLFLAFSQSITEQILQQADTDVAVDQFNGIMWKSYYMSIISISGPVVIQEVKHYVIGAKLAEMRQRKLASSRGIELTSDWNAKLTKAVEEQILTKTAADRGITQAVTDEVTQRVTNPGGILDNMMNEMPGGGFPTMLEESFNADIQSTARQRAKNVLGDALTKEMKEKLAKPAGRSIEDILDKIKIKPMAEMTFPFLMTEMLVIFALYGMLALRYLMTMVWVILLPFTIFLYSFELTKGLGKNMAEQTIFWTVLQIFYAVSTAAIGIGLSILPDGFDYFKIGPPEPFGFLSISFFSLAAVVMFLLTPILMLQLSQRLIAQ